MKKCTSCNTENQEESRFCFMCGGKDFISESPTAGGLNIGDGNTISAKEVYGHKEEINTESYNVTNTTVHQGLSVDDMIKLAGLVGKKDEPANFMTLKVRIDTNVNVYKDYEFVCEASSGALTRLTLGMGSHILRFVSKQDEKAYIEHIYNVERVGYEELYMVELKDIEDKQLKESRELKIGKYYKEILQGKVNLTDNEIEDELIHDIVNSGNNLVEAVLIYYNYAKHFKGDIGEMSNYLEYSIDMINDQGLNEAGYAIPKIMPILELWIDVCLNYKPEQNRKKIEKAYESYCEALDVMTYSSDDYARKLANAYLAYAEYLKKVGGNWNEYSQKADETISYYDL